MVLDIDTLKKRRKIIFSLVNDFHPFWIFTHLLLSPRKQLYISKMEIWVLWYHDLSQEKIMIQIKLDSWFESMKAESKYDFFQTYDSTHGYHLIWVTRVSDLNHVCFMIWIKQSISKSHFSTSLWFDSHLVHDSNQTFNILILIVLTYDSSQVWWNDKRTTF